MHKESRFIHAVYLAMTHLKHPHRKVVTKDVFEMECLRSMRVVEQSKK